METQNNEQEKKERRKHASKVGGLLFVGCMFVGMAFGWYYDAYQIGLFGGMGVGFIMMAVTHASLGNKK